MSVATLSSNDESLRSVFACYFGDGRDDDDHDDHDDFEVDMYIMMKCMCVTKNHHFLLGVSCNHPGWFFMVLGRFLWFFMVLGQVL